MSELLPFTHYEIKCVEFIGGYIDGALVEPVHSLDGVTGAVIWTLYGRHANGGVSAIGDYNTAKDAADMYHYITGHPAPEIAEGVFDLVALSR